MRGLDALRRPVSALQADFDRRDLDGRCYSTSGDQFRAGPRGRSPSVRAWRLLAVGFRAIVALAPVAGQDRGAFEIIYSSIFFASNFKL